MKVLGQLPMCGSCFGVDMGIPAWVFVTVCGAFQVQVLLRKHQHADVSRDAKG